MDAELRALQDAILTLINASHTPIEAKRLILENLLIKVTQKADLMIQDQIKEKEKRDGTDKAD